MMKTDSRVKSLVLLFVLLVAMPIAVPAAVPDTYDWFEDADGYAKAHEIAKNEKRPLIVYIRVDWCGYCKYLDKELLDDHDVDDYVSNYLRVRINPEHGKEEAAIASRYKVRGYPSFLVTYPHLEKASRVHPFRGGGKVWTAEQFIEAIRKEIEGSTKPAAAQ